MADLKKEILVFREDLENKFVEVVKNWKPFEDPKIAKNENLRKKWINILIAWMEYEFRGYRGEDLDEVIDKIRQLPIDEQHRLQEAVHVS